MVISLTASAAFARKPSHPSRRTQCIYIAPHNKSSSFFAPQYPEKVPSFWDHPIDSPAADPIRSTKKKASYIKSFTGIASTYHTYFDDPR
jgi:hypothetical protein